MGKVSVIPRDFSQEIQHSLSLVFQGFFALADGDFPLGMALLIKRKSNDSAF